jgi:PAS domain S-box-containing protein
MSSVVEEYKKSSVLKNIYLFIERQWTVPVLLAFVLVGLYVTSRNNFLLFHTLAELFSIIVAYTIFVLAWKSRNYFDNGYLLFIGIAYFFIANIDLLHTLAYRGMGVFPALNTNPPTQLWLAARYLQAVSLLIAPVFLHRKVSPRLLFLLFFIISVFIMLSIFSWDLFPDAHIDGVGLTQFKIISEYIISLILAGSMVLLLRNRQEFNPRVLQWIILSIATAIISELAFTEYIGVYDGMNMVGHQFKIISFYFIYTAIVETGFDKPFDFLFRKLKQSEEALGLSEARLRRLVESNIIGVVFFNRNGQIHSSNEAFLKTLGYNPDELDAGKLNWKSLTPEEYHGRDEQGISESLSRGACTPYEKELIRKDGSKVTILIGYALFEGNTLEYIAFILDLTERQKARADLQRIEWLLTKSVEKNTQKASFKKQHANPVAERSGIEQSRILMDIVGEEVLEDVVSDFLELLDTSAAVFEENGDFALWTFSSGWCQFLSHASRDLCNTDDDREAILCGKWHCHQSCWHQSSRISIDRREPVDTECLGGIKIYAVPILAAGKVVGAISVGYGDLPKEIDQIKAIAERYGIPDEQLMKLSVSYETRPPFIIEIAKNRLNVSARLLGAIVENKQAESLIQDYASQLEKTNQDLKDFAFIASHDLQEPLRKIQSFGERLELKYKDLLDEEGSDYLERMKNSSARLQRMIQDLLAYSRVSTQPNPFCFVELSKVVSEVISDLEIAVTSKRAEISVGPLPTIEADPLQMRLLFQNLMSNAIKFHKKNLPPKVSVSTLAPGPSHSYTTPIVRVIVSDNGIGFDEAYSEKIFQPFQRLVGKSQYEGSGIGLAICRKIVERHKGVIEVKSEPGEGTSFTISLPVRQKPEVYN